MVLLSMPCMVRVGEMEALGREVGLHIYVLYTLSLSVLWEREGR